MRRVLTTVLTAALLVAAHASPGNAGAARGKQTKQTGPTKRRLATWRGGRVRLHQTRGAHKETQYHDADYAALARPGGRLMYSGAEMVRWARGHVKGKADGLVSHYLRDSGSNRFSIDMRPQGVTVTARVTDGAAAQPRDRRPGYTVQRDRQNPRRELHVFEFAARETVSLSSARSIAMTRYRRGRPEAAGRLIPSSERLIVRPDGTQRLTISFDPAGEHARLPLD